MISIPLRERWLSLGHIRRIPALVMASILLVAASGWWIHTVENRKLAATAPAAGSATALSWQNDGVIGNVDLFTMISTKASGTKLYALSNHDRSTYQRIFEAQESGDWARANALMKRLGNDILIGHVLYDRYINSAEYRASYAELREWMVQYGDHPNAYRVYQLAQKRRANDPATLPAPQMAKRLLGSLEIAWLTKNIKKPANQPKMRNNAAVRDLTHKVKSYLSRDAVTRAYEYLDQAPAAKSLTAIEHDTLLSEIAAGYYYNQKYDTALSVALQATGRSKEAVPYAAWIGGLSAWQQDDYKTAAQQFSLIPKSHTRSPWMLSAGSFWAARAHERIGNRKAADTHLRQAAAFSRTFYGLLAQAKLGKDTGFSWESPTLTSGLVATLKSHPSGERALALLDIGKKDLAARELKQVHPEGDRQMAKAMVATAAHFNLPSLAMQLGNTVGRSDGRLYDIALYPVVPWKGDEAAGVDPALVNALIRQESKFDIEARNRRSGATGLMQLMPRTAKFVSDASFDASDITDPEVNVALGQRYVRYLLDMQRIDGNMLYLAAAYNAGPGNLARWQKKIDYKNDPLLFIESIPISETRAYVGRVMTNYWIYNQRLGQEDRTLRQLAKGSWPVYRVRDNLKMASN